MDKRNIARSRREKSSSRILAKDLYISNDTRSTGLCNNDLIIGPSGSGKTGGYVIPNLLTLDQSMVVIDTKGQLYRHYADDLKVKGFTVRYLDFKDPEKASDTYNPFDFIRYRDITETVDGKTYKHTVFREQDVLTIASALLPETKHEDPFWIEASRMVLSGLISYVCEKIVPKDRHFGAVSEVYRHLCRELPKVQKKASDISFFTDLADEDPDSFAVKLYQQFRPCMLAEKTWGSISQFISNVMFLFDIRENASMLCHPSSFSLADLGREKTVLFVNVSDTDRASDGLLSLLYTQLFQVLCNEADAEDDGMLKIPVRIILDDFATNLKIKDFDKIISVIRSRQIEVSIILQSISQLGGLYDEACSSTIINNCDHLLYLGGQDTKTADFISTKANKLPETILKMPNDHVYLFERGKDAMYVEKIKPYSFSAEHEPAVLRQTESNPLSGAKEDQCYE